MTQRSAKSPSTSCFTDLCDMKPAIYVTKGNIGEGSGCVLLAVVVLSVIGYFCLSPTKEYELSGKIGKAIIKLRSANGISQEKMTLEAKIDRRYMSDIENGKRNISLDILCKIAEFLDLPLSDFIAKVEDPTQYNGSNDELKCPRVSSSPLTR